MIFKIKWLKMHECVYRQPSTFEQFAISKIYFIRFLSIMQKKLICQLCHNNTIQYVSRVIEIQVYFGDKCLIIHYNRWKNKFSPWYEPSKNWLTLLLGENLAGDLINVKNIYNFWFFFYFPLISNIQNLNTF